MTYSEYLQSDHWLKLRAVVLKRDGHKCTRCPCRRHLQVHHLVYRAKFEDSLPEDLTTLCEPCHAREHEKPSKTTVVVINGGVFRPKGNPLKRKKKKLNLSRKELKLRRKYSFLTNPRRLQ